jgi:hypothetical protein
MTQEVKRMEEKLDKDAICHLFYLTYTASTLPRNFLKIFKTEGKVIRTLKYAYDLVLLAKDETVLQCTINRLAEAGRWYGMEINMEETKVIIISRQPSPVQIIRDKKQLENV